VLPPKIGLGVLGSSEGTFHGSFILPSPFLGAGLTSVSARAARCSAGCGRAGARARSCVPANELRQDATGACSMAADIVPALLCLSC